MSRFTKIGPEGEKLTDDAAEWVAVLDNTTSLLWTVKETKRLTWSKAQAAVAKLDTADLKDWRLPTVEEAMFIPDRSKYPAVDPTFFPDFEDYEWIWTSTPDAKSPSDYAWIVLLRSGDVLRYDQTHHSSVRAVRAGQ